MISIYLVLSGSVHLERKYIVHAFKEGAFREVSLYYKNIKINIGLNAGGNDRRSMTG